MCIFCKIINGEIPSYKVYEDEVCIAILDISQATYGHTLVIPKNHYTNIFDIDDDVLGHIGNVASKLAKKYQQVLKLEGLNLINNNGAIAGQVVNHYHLHIVPRYEDDNLVDAIYTNNGDKVNFKELLELLTN